MVRERGKAKDTVRGLQFMPPYGETCGATEVPGADGGLACKQLVFSETSMSSISLGMLRNYRTTQDTTGDPRFATLCYSSIWESF